MEALIFVLIIYIAVGIVVRTLARLEIIWCTIPGNTYAEVISQPNSEEVKVGLDSSKATAATGGDPVKILHAIGGHKVVYPSGDWMEWELVPGRQIRGLMYYLYRVHFKGFWWSLAETRIREFRKGMDDKETETVTDKDSVGLYRILRKIYITKRPWFTRELAVIVESAETKSGYPVRALLIFKYKVTKPSKVRLSVADANALLASIAIQAFKTIVQSETTDYYMYGEKKNREDLVDEIKERVNVLAPEEIGITISAVILDDIDVDAETRALLELNRKNELEGDAKITESEKNAKVTATTAAANLDKKMKENQGEANYVETVLKPMAADERTVEVVRALAYRDNPYVTTYAPGGGLLVSVSVDKKTDSGDKKP